MPATLQHDSQASGQGTSALAIFASQTGKLKLALISLSIANLCFLLTWKQVLGLVEDSSVRYYQERAPDSGILLALIADVCVVALVVFFFGRLCRSATKPLRLLGFAGCLTFAALGFYQLQRFLTESLHEWKPERSWEALKLAAACVLLLLVLRFPRRVLPALTGLLLILSPVFFLLAFNGIWQFQTTDLHHVKNEKPAPLIPGTSERPHLVWITFDELDNRIVFDVRPPRIQLPEFDRLRGESIYSKVRAPSTDTLWAMPSFLLGKRVTQVQMDTSRLRVKFKDGAPWVDTRNLPNLFERTRAIGLNSGLTGWHHPYCRLFGDSLSDCSWISFGGPVVRVEKMLRSRSFFEKAVYLLNWQARWSIPRIIEPLHWVAPEPEEARMWREQQISDMQFVVSNGLRMLRDPRLNLVFIHIATPHPAGIWDTRAKKYTLENSDYVDNLALADAVLGQIRTVMEQTGEWDNSTVLVSGDHPYRTGMWKDSSIWTPEMAHLTESRYHPYVPFFLKLPAQHAEVDYTTEFNNVLSADLAIELLSGRLKTPQNVVDWLNARAAGSLNK